MVIKDAGSAQENVKKSISDLELVIVPEDGEESQTSRTWRHSDEAIFAPYDERNWSLFQLRDIFHNKAGLETLYEKYQIRLQHSYFIVYLLTQAFLSALTITIECIGLPAKEVMENVITHGLVMTACLSLLVVIYDEKLFLGTLSSGSVNDDRDSSRSSWVPKASAALVFVPLLAMQIVMAVKHANGREFMTHWNWSFYIVLVCYIFFPLKTSVIVDVLMMVGANALGLYFCFMTEIVFRQSFLDKRASIEAKCKREYEEETEEHLFSSIIPKTMVKELRESLREAVQAKDKDKEKGRDVLPSIPRKPFANLFARFHQNVSILYADIVNFTPLTVSMNEEDLVRLLNDLFGKFDEAVKEHNCLRIKLLGDCYYCVSGIPESTEKHAWNCVNVGLKMIAIIREVREQWGVKNLDMRIGIHSGSVYSCILGISKWQFDIWSTDAKIANHMEQAGQPGCVHISKATHKALGKDHGFYFETGRKDSYLEEKGVTTFFIPLSQNKFIPREERTSIQSGTMNRLLSLPNSQWLKPEEIQPFFIAFRDLKLECNFIKQPDMLIKYPIMAASILIIILGIIELLSEAEIEDIITWVATILVMLTMTFWAWIGSIHAKWLKWKKAEEHEESPMWKKIKKVPQRLIVSAWIRILLFVVSALGAILAATISIIVRCERTSVEKCSSLRVRNRFCLHPSFLVNIPFTFHFRFQYLTQEFALVLSTIFVFYRIHFLLKLGAMVVTLSAYGILVQKFFSEVSPGWDMNPVPQGKSPLFPHIHYLLVILLILHVIDRQSEYLFKLDYKWKRSLQEEQEEANLTRKVNRSLIFNILPAHLADRYLNPRYGNELYHERYRSAAVMFATILDFSSEGDTDFPARQGEPWAEDVPQDDVKNALTLLNDIISEFDRLLFSYKRVQKIKLIGTTYMAAVGLEPGENGSWDDDDDVTDLAAAHNSSTMVAFAIGLIDLLTKCNRGSNQEFSLRIGIACGPLIAGVVGAEKPLYDIWGDTVNMASRLESTGKRWEVHISEEVNSFLRRLNVHSLYRGLTEIKGKTQLIPTYFVDIKRFRNKGQHVIGLTNPDVPDSFHHQGPKRNSESRTSDWGTIYKKSLDSRNLCLRGSRASMGEHLQWRIDSPLEDLYETLVLDYDILPHEPPSNSE
ncbi:unnamed protein product [Darwinula stevensoni]|uniref:adenylate cyclase n=1 Tax=Darwinula stevensoni TaxID=69355 RepID=A0A7R9ABD1_9CRUS|nr:unnamed protein product [Darwinula stevensoni]CAG0899295.1 unnamed protein product [Darwinula stevensoni]